METGKFEKLFLVYFIVAFIFLVAPSFAAAIVESGYCGGEGNGYNLTYMIDSDGVLTISGTGRMADWEYQSSKYPHSPWYNRSDIRSIVIEEGVTTIGDGAFSQWNGSENITFISMDLPSTIQSIGTGSFYNNDQIRSIALNSGIETIGDYAFANSRLESVLAQFSGLKTIGEHAFHYCLWLDEMIMPDTVESVGYAAFFESGLQYVSLSHGLRSLPANCFYSTHIESVFIPSFEYCFQRAVGIHLRKRL